MAPWAASDLAALFALLLTLLSAPARAQGSADPAELPPVITGAYRINVGDVLDVEFQGIERLDRSVTVGPDGMIVLPFIGRVRAAGRTVDEAMRHLADLFGEELVDPRITVAVSQFSGMLVYVGGEVNAPGMRPYRGGLTLVQAIMEAGGFATTARLREVILIRKAPDRTPVGTVVDVKHLLRAARFDHDLELAPADVIFVPRKRIANVNLFIEQFLTNNIPFDLYLGYSLAGGG